MSAENGSKPCVTAIIPTMCQAQRRHSLFRAIDSLLAQPDVIVRPTVVINGTRFDPAIVEELHARSDIRLQIMPGANLPMARLAGRALVDTEFFCFLDDDDCYLPGTLATRLAPMMADQAIDLTVSNGYTMVGGHREPLIHDFASVAADPLRALMHLNWLSSAGGLYRTASISHDFLDLKLEYFEWTVLAFKLCLLKKKMAFVQEPTFCVNDTPGSMSKLDAYAEAETTALRIVLELPMDATAKCTIRAKLGRALHALADRRRIHGDLPSAWRAHIGSLMTPRGLRLYLAYTRKLFWGRLTPRPVTDQLGNAT